MRYNGCVQEKMFSCYYSGKYIGGYIALGEYNNYFGNGTRNNSRTKGMKGKLKGGDR